MKWIGQHIFDLKSKFRNDVDITGDVTITGTLDVSGISTSATHFVLGDDDKIKLGTGDDGEIYVNGDDLYIKNVTSDKDIIFSINDGGTPAEIMRIDGSTSNVGIGVAAPASLLHVAGTVQVGVDDTGHDVKFFGATSGRYLLWDESADALKFTDSTQLILGTGNDLIIQHASSNSYINSFVGDFYIKQQANDKDIIFQNDDGSGGTAEYFRVDGSSENVLFSKLIKLSDSVELRIGDGNDFKMFSDGTDGYISGETGDLYIRQRGNDKDIIFQSDDGSGGVATYFSLDGSATNMKAYKTMRFSDNAKVELGDSGDLQLLHDGSASYIVNTVGNMIIANNTDDGDIYFQSDNGSGGVETYFFLDGSLSSGNPRTVFPDNSVLGLGTGADLQLYHDGSNGVIQNLTGSLTIQSTTDDSDVILKSDDGSGGLAAYLTLDGGDGHTIANKEIQFLDSVPARFGSGNDLAIRHTGSHSFVSHDGTGNLYIDNTADDKDIIFRSDDGAGGVTTYFSLDGSEATHDGSATTNLYTIWPDNSRIALGTGKDIRILHNGTSGFFQNITGDLEFRNFADDKDIIFQSDDGSGGVTPYFYLDGSISASRFPKNVLWDDNVKALFGGGSGDLQIYHDGSNSYIKNAGTGNLKIMGNNLYLQNTSGGSYIDGINGDRVDIKFNNSTKLTTTNTGVEITGELQADSLDIDGVADISGNTQLGGTLTVGVDDTGHDVKFFGATSGEYMLWDESEDALRLTDNTQLRLGIGNDLRLWHNGTNSYVFNYTGNLYVGAGEADKDTVFLGDDGSGGDIAYITLDGSAGYTTVQKNMVFADSISSRFGTGGDLAIFHNGSQGYISLEGTGDLYIRNTTNDKDVILQSDDGSGGVTAYLTLDGGDGHTIANKEIQFLDSVVARFGTGNDFKIHHDGTNTLLVNNTGSLFIDNYADNADTYFRNDNGAGGIATYFFLDGSAATHDGSATTSLQTVWPDNSRISLGTGHDLQFKHTGSLSTILNQVGDLYILNSADNKDIIFQCDDGSGGAETYFFLDGSTGVTTFPDDKRLTFGTDRDLFLYHTGSQMVMKNYVGDMTFTNNANDKDIIFQSDDGSGGVTAYLTLDGSGSQIHMAKPIRFPDSVSATWGASGDLEIFHNGTYSNIANATGHLYIDNNTDDGDIVFRSDDGSGGLATYLTLDGGIGYTTAQKHILFQDNVKARFGSGSDLQVYHNGSNSYIEQAGTGDLYIQQTRDDKDIVLQSDDGSGGVATYLSLDGSAGTVEVAKEMNLAVPLATDQQKHVMHYDFQGYATGDGTNYEMVQAITDTNAPFEHNTSLGEDGTTATTVQNIIRSGGKTMPRACTLTRWTGWAAAAGSQTAYVALFKVTPTRNNNTDLSAVLLDAFSYTALGNAKMEGFDETSFTATAIEAGDILITAMKSQSGAIHYFTSTVEVEF